MNTTTLNALVGFTITVPEGMTPVEAQNQFYRIFSDYLTREDCPFQEDYGPQAWGGYDGPTVQTVTVTV